MQIPGAEFIARYGVLWVFAATFSERLGAPIFVTPLLLAAGALAVRGTVHFGTLFVVTTVACVVGDTLWYELSRWKGAAFLSLLCKVSFQPESLVERAQSQLIKHAGVSLFWAKWLPGFAHLTVPMAGYARVSRRRFHVYNTCGSMFWAVCLLTGGYLSASGMNWSSALRVSSECIVGLALAASLATIAYSYYRRNRCLKSFARAREWRQGRKRTIRGHHRFRLWSFLQLLWPTRSRAMAVE